MKCADGTEVILDPDMEIALAGYSWHVVKGPNNRTVYASRAYYENRKQIRVFMHHDVIGVPPPGFQTDHINGNGLDNRRENLRNVTASVNKQNHGKPRWKNAVSKFKGVTKAKSGRWVARIGHNYRLVHIGVFNTEKEAALAYNSKAKELYGEMAFQNEVEQ